MPASPTLPTSISADVTPNHDSDHQVINGVVNGIYKASIGTTRTTNYTLVQNNTGEVIPVSSASTVAITVPSLEAGTSIEVVRLGAGAVTFTASGVTFVVPTGSSASARATGSTVSLLWLTTTSVLVGGDLT